MGNSEFLEKAKRYVLNYYAQLNISGEVDELLTKDDVYVVWVCKTLQNNKALLSTTYKDTRYFEVTYNGDKDETYFDAYVKEQNLCIKFE